MEILNFILLVIVLLLQFFLIYKIKKINKENNQVRYKVQNDTLYEDAKELASQVDEISITYLQEKLQIGPVRATNLLKLLEKNNIIESDDNNSTSRKIIKKDN